MSKIKVYIKEPGKKLRSTNIENTLENLQKWVGGYIETFNVVDDLTIICNEEGKILGLPYNFSMMGQTFVGTCIFCGIDGEEFSDVKVDYQVMKVVFPQLFELDEEQLYINKQIQEAGYDSF